VFQDSINGTFGCTLEEYCQDDAVLSKRQRRGDYPVDSYRVDCTGSLESSFIIRNVQNEDYDICDEDWYCSPFNTTLEFDSGLQKRTVVTTKYVGNFTGTQYVEYGYICDEITRICQHDCQRFLVNGYECDGCESCLENRQGKQTVLDCANLHSNFTESCDWVAAHSSVIINLTASHPIKMTLSRVSSSRTLLTLPGSNGSDS
jgi:hypothetical protein